MKSFTYHQPKTIEEASQFLEKFGNLSAILAGGTDLMVQMKNGVVSPENLIDLKQVKGLNSIIEQDDGYLIGALTSLSDLGNHSGLRERLPIICSSAKTVGSTQIRNSATIGGNICNASPSADTVPCLIALDAEVNLHGPAGKRRIPLEAFCKGPRVVDLQKGELLESIFVPFPPKGTKQIYIKHGPRSAMDIALVGVAVTLSTDENTGICQKARVALCAVAPTPVRAKNTEKLLESKNLQDISLDMISESVGKEVSPISDLRASAGYRKTMVSTLTVRAVDKLVGKTLESGNG